MNFKLNFGWFNIYLESTIFKTRNGEVEYGYTNRCEDGKYNKVVMGEKMRLTETDKEIIRIVEGNTQRFLASDFLRAIRKKYPHTYNAIGESVLK